MLKLKADELRQQVLQILRNHPELEDDEILRMDMIEGSTDAVEFLRWIENTRQDVAGQLAGLNERIYELQERRDRFENRERRLRELMFGLLQAGQVRKLELPEATLSVKSTPAHVVIYDPTEVPDDYWRVHRELDRQKIKEALITAAVVPGATLSNSADTLSIRIR
jgi:Siphovirus Gp157